MGQDQNYQDKSWLLPALEERLVEFQAAAPRWLLALQGNLPGAVRLSQQSGYPGAVTELVQANKTKKTYTTQWSVVSENLAVIAIYIAYLITDVCILMLWPYFQKFLSSVSPQRNLLYTPESDTMEAAAAPHEGSISVQGSLNVPWVQFAWLFVAAAVKCFFIYNEFYKYKYETSVSYTLIMQLLLLLTLIFSK